MQNSGMILVTYLQLGHNSFCKSLDDHESFRNLIYLVGENETVTLIYDTPALKE